MSRKVYTYRSIAALKEHPQYRQIERCPHITATSDLAQAIRKAYPQICSVMDIHKLQKDILPHWEAADTSFQQFLTISRVVRGLSVKKEEILHKSFIKNKLQVLNAIRLLVEADATPEDIVPQNIEEALFQRVWEEMEQEETSLTEFRVALGAYEEEPERFKAFLEREESCLQASTIVLHGFYFITPIQERIFDILENCGKELIFLCCVDSALPEVNAVWHELLAKDEHFDRAGRWVTNPSGAMPAREFGTVFGDAPELVPLHNVSIIKYESSIDFVRDVERLLKEERTVFSTDVKGTEALLKEFYPTIYKRRHLLSFPVGQYVYKLHAMWNAKESRLTMSVDDVQTCFASGWVEKDGVNALKHMHGLEKIKTYVSDCRTMEEWEERLILLQETKEAVLANFEQHIEEMPQKNRRWHRMMADPFLNFSCFTYDEASLQELIGLIRHLIKTAKELFGEKGEVNISRHLTKIRKILTAKMDSQLLLEEERAIIDELCSRLRYNGGNISKCLPGEIAEAIIMVVGGGILDDENYSVQAGVDESFIKPLYQVEASSLLGNGKVHLCLADEDRLPGKTSPFVWPLNNAFLDRLAIRKDERRYHYLEDMRFIIDKAGLAKRYLFFILLQNRSVEISWVATENDKVVGPSPYVHILKELFSVPEVRSEKQLWSEEEVASIKEEHCVETLQIDLAHESAIEARIDAVICPWRYLYGYVLQEAPAFYTDFHYGFVLSNLISAITKVSGMPRKTIGDAVLELFPYLRAVEKQQIMDHVTSISEDDSDGLDHVAYPYARKLVHFLQRKLVKDGEEALADKVQKTMCYDAPLVDNAEYMTCMYCPQNGFCPHATHDPEGEV